MQSKKIIVKIPNIGVYDIYISYSYSGTTTEVVGSPTQFINNWSIYDEWNEWFINSQLPNKKEEDKSIKSCFHEWIEYTGFTDHYWYCEKCDAKSEENPNKCF